MKQQTNTLLIISGPTAVGKTDLCINLAKKFNTFIISADSRQFFREMNIGTAKPAPNLLEMVPHHFINSHSIHDSYDVRRYETEVLELLKQEFPTYNPIILTGGSGLYVDAVVYGLDVMPDIDPKWREELNDLFRKEGLSVLQNQLKSMDPDYYAIVDLQNPQRVIRALEVCMGTGKPYSSFRIKKSAERPFHILKIALIRDRDELYQRINLRMDQMIDEGLFEEAKELYPYRHLNALQTVGYTEIFGYMDGLYDREEAIRLLKRNSRRYAKRQLTWLRKDPDYHWFHPDALNEIESFILNQIAR
ncbi:MAG: tRNA (adenosine(37)-N6)-dimethylallyltransferase MiaA [Lunatimonas sp.]|uniref:tRNA (adenosine(37)-N6)-dimethylallyltransferase MiaA n=1 Tax=Lunatimonas sp. TaxID=2060141 RepID=UPI00263AA3E1|nr:tRNA (adenosine(37)-N6)-dimethylallyltransferase MiaA [Lunatimonas sp.]MCC5936272.1 tRNA (adenosine(37)-N6)-dimethylallyltransferase MiaA [Lunatimonas sp.]